MKVAVRDQTCFSGLVIDVTILLVLHIELLLLLLLFYLWLINNKIRGGAYFNLKYQAYNRNINNFPFWHGFHSLGCFIFPSIIYSTEVLVA